MRRVLLTLLAMFSILAFSSCDKDNDNERNDVVGTWMMRADGYHYFDATFSANGTYEWVWMGASGILKDTGSYKYADHVITMTPSKYYREDDENPDKLQSVSASDFGWSGPRTVTVVSVEKGIAYWHWQGDFIIDDSNFFTGDEGEPVLVFRKGYDYKIKKSDLLGTWDSRDEYGATRIVLGQDTFSLYSVWEREDGSLSVGKDTGTWALDSNVITLTTNVLYTSSKRVWNPVTQKNEYVYYEVDPVTFEASQWESYTYPEPIVTEYYIYLSGNRIISNKGSFEKKK